MREDWEYIELCDCVDVINGLWTGKKEPFINIAVIRNTNFSKDCKLNLDNVAYIDVEQKQYATRKLVYGDIIIEKSGGSEKQPVGRPILFNVDEGEYSFSNFTATLRLNGKYDISSIFLQRCLYHYYINGETLKMQSKTTGLHNLDMKAYMKLPIPVPPREEQERIVSELDLLSGILEKEKAEVKELERLAESIFDDMFGDPVENERGWKVKTIGDCFPYIKNGANIKQDKNASGYPISRIETLSGGKFNRDKLGYANIFDIGKFSDYILCSHDLLISHINSKVYIGRTVEYIKEDNEVIIHGMNLLRMKENSDVINSTFFAFYAHTDTYKSSIAKIRKDAVNQSSFTITDFKQIKVPLPPLSLQREFAERIERIEEEKGRIRRAIEETGRLFDYTMERYFG